MDELNILLNELKRAEDNFNNATEEYIDAATYDLNAINEKINQYFKERRKANERRS
ncbi:hypothetical protein [Proteiniborus sp.]|uniref:hypothetical protein n=1 Tax=Proteiniborus sp. TaxID=2079015 RepID=UPI003320A521